LKTIGLLGGMSWESTVSYYQTINRTVAERMGGLHSAPLVLHSVDFHEIERLQRSGRWDEAGSILTKAALGLQTLGADLLVLCTNTMHKIAPQIEAELSIPLLHVADATADAVRQAGIRRVGLLGTKFTMEEAFYRDRLESHGLEVTIPPPPERDAVHRIIYDELCLGRILEASSEAYQRVVAGLVDRGAGGVILGCTEISMLLDGSAAAVPLFDTTAIHARAAALIAIGAVGSDGKSG
jgi:aspartate racemase